MSHWSRVMSRTSVALSRLELTSQHLARNYATKTPAAVAAVEQGVKYSTTYKNYATNAATGKIVSWFHDVPLDLDPEAKTANMVVEIPRWSNAKFEIDTKAPANPIVQDVKKGEVRFVKNLFPNHGYIHNYGAFPQTWEDPTTKNAELNLFGDNDPLDVCEIGAEILETGDVKKVKILGSIALIDDGELDWKVIVVDVNDSLASKLFDIHDIYTQCPGLLETTRQWFRDYKLPDGKPQNRFAFNGQYKNQKETMEIIAKCNNSWKQLINCEIKNDNLPVIENSTLVDSPEYVGEFNSNLLNNERGPDASIPTDIHKTYYIPTD